MVVVDDGFDDFDDDDDDDDDVFWQLPATLSIPTIPSPIHQSKSEC